jgi:hypothetical protein
MFVRARTKKWLPTWAPAAGATATKAAPPCQAVGQQQRLGGPLGQQLQRQGPFRLAAPADGRGQGMMQAQFEQHAGGDFGEGGPPAPAFGLARRGLALRRVGQTELRAVQRDPPPAPPERLGRRGRLGQGTQPQPHQLRGRPPTAGGCGARSTNCRPGNRRRAGRSVRPTCRRRSSHERPGPAAPGPAARAADARAAGARPAKRRRNTPGKPRENPSGPLPQRVAVEQ